MTICYRWFGGGYQIQHGNWPVYYGYSKREAFRKFRLDHGLVGRHIRFIDMDKAPSLESLMFHAAKLARIRREIGA